MRNRMARQKQLLVTILAVALTALLLVTACAPQTPPPEEGEKIVEIGDIETLTGGGGTATQPAFQGFQDYVRYFNEEKGIPGVTIEHAWRDTKTDPGLWISAYRTLVDRGVPVIYTITPVALEGMKPQFEKDQIPVVTAGVTGTMVYPPSWIFPVWATQGEATSAVLDYFMQNWREERPPRLQLFVMDGVYGIEPVEETTKYAESIGFEVLPLELSPYVVLDATTQLLRMEARGADLLYLNQLITGAGPILRDAERLGLEDKMQFSGTQFVQGEPLIKYAPVAAEGFLAERSLPWVDETEIPGVKTMADRQTKWHGEPVYMSGWVYGAIVCEALRSAIEEVGYENVDGPAVKMALESMKGFDVDGMVKITFGPEDRRGTQSYAVYQVQGGKIVRITDWREVPILVPWEQ